jgi:hypothetical protein
MNSGGKCGGCSGYDTDHRGKIEPGREYLGSSGSGLPGGTYIDRIESDLHLDASIRVESKCGGVAEHIVLPYSGAAGAKDDLAGILTRIAP